MDIKTKSLDQITNNAFSHPGNQQQVELVYYTDPLCCWSWAFEPQWRKLQFEFKGVLNIRHCMTGLIADWKSFNDPVNNISRPVQMGPVWLQAAHMSGMPLNAHVWVSDPPASSYLACMAVKAAGLQSPPAASAFLRAVREAIMLQGINISRASALLKVAATLASSQPQLLNLEQFEKDMENGRAKNAFEQDLKEVRLNGITRCPTLVFRYANRPAVMTAGYRSYAILVNVLNQVAPGIQKTQQVTSADQYISYWGSLTNRELEEALVGVNAVAAV
jgi:predicted DsbA family dithiol-disulfide isomerase